MTTDTPDLRAAIATVRAAGFRVARYDDEHVAKLGERLWNARMYQSKLMASREDYTAKAHRWADQRVAQSLVDLKSYLGEGDPTP